jgi:hypothetical protein
MFTLLLILQLFQVLFLALHDWVPLGRLNNVPAVHAADPPGRLIRVTLISTLPYVFGLAASISFAGGATPAWLRDWLWISYGLLLAGQIRAWWIPYLLLPDPARAARYQAMFAGTHAVLPQRHGITPNTLHLVLHATTLATLILLAGTAHR